MLDPVIHVANEALRMVDKPELFPDGDKRLEYLRELAGGDMALLVEAASHCRRISDRGELLRTWRDPTGPGGAGPKGPARARDEVAEAACDLLVRASA